MDSWIVVSSTPAGPVFYGENTGWTRDPVGATRMSGNKAHTLVGRILRVSAKRAAQLGQPMQATNVRAIDLKQPGAYDRSNPESVMGWASEHYILTTILVIFGLSAVATIFGGWRVA